MIQIKCCLISVETHLSKLAHLKHVLEITLLVSLAAMLILCWILRAQIHDCFIFVMLKKVMVLIKKVIDVGRPLHRIVYGVLFPGICLSA
jgi:hypothetical protein